MASFGARTRALLEGELSRSLAAVLSFAVALGATTVIYPLLAVESGFSAGLVGLFTSISAGAQLSVRLALPWLLSVVPDRRLILAASGIMLVSALVLVGSQAWVAFVVAQLFQGASRAILYTSSQSHVVRAEGVAVNRLAQLAMASKIGGLSGPLIAGAVASIDVGLALWVTVFMGGLAAAASMLMAHRSPYQRATKEDRRGTWRRTELAAGYWTAFAAGGWRGLIGSYVPVLLSATGLAAGIVGALVSLTEGAHLVASTFLARAKRISLHRLRRLAAVGLLIGAGTLPLMIDLSVVAAAGALVLAGFCGGLVTTVGAAIANEHAISGEQGTALAVAGAYRAAGRMVSPSAVAAGAGLLGLPGAVAAVALLFTGPAFVLRGRRAARARS